MQPVTGLGLTIPAGTRLNGIFEIERQIGAGGMGMVYRAHNVETGDAVAIKIVRAELADNTQVIALFRKEAAVLNKLLHDAIVRYYLFTTDPGIGRPYLATEFVDGTSLADLAEEGPLDRDDVLALAIRVADGLRVAHEVPIFHRDISPDNVILPSRDVSRAKIIDFGIARAANLGGGTVIGDSIAGKFDYMSPEQLGLFGAQVDGRSDIYSLGIVLAEATLGRSLDMGGTQLEVVEKRRKVPDLSDIEPNLRQLLTAMTQPKPDDRIPSMAAVVEQAEALRRGEGKRGLGKGVKIAAGLIALAVVGGGAYVLLDREGAFDVANVPPGTVPVARDPSRPPALPRVNDTTQITTPEFPSLPEPVDDTEPLQPEPPTPDIDDPVANIPPDDTAPPELPQTPPADPSAADTPPVLPPIAEPVDDDPEIADPLPPEPEPEPTDPANPPVAVDDDPDAQPTDTADVPQPDTSPVDDTPNAQTPTPPSADPVPVPDITDQPTQPNNDLVVDEPQIDNAQTPAPAPEPPVEPDIVATPVDEPVTDEPDTNEPVVDEPVVDEPVTDQPDVIATPDDPLPDTPSPPDADTPIVTNDDPTPPSIPVDPTDDDAGGSQPNQEIVAVDPDTITPPEPVQEPPLHPVLQYVRDANLGPCTHLRVASHSDDAAVINGYGASVPTFAQFHSDFQNDFGFEALVNLRPITRAQCAAVDLVEALTPSGGGTLNFQLDRDQITDGDILSGEITGLDGRALEVFLVASDGRLYSLDQLVTRDGDEASLYTIMSGPAGPSQSHLLVAIASPDMPAMPQGAPLEAQDALPALANALATVPDSEAILSFFRYDN